MAASPASTSRPRRRRAAIRVWNVYTAARLDLRLFAVEPFGDRTTYRFRLQVRGGIFTGMKHPLPAVAAR